MMIKGMTTGRIKLLVLAVLTGAAVLAITWPRGIEAADATASLPVRLTLAEAIDLAARQSPELVSSMQALELSRSRLRESSGSRQPKVVLQGSYYDTSVYSVAGGLTSDSSSSARPSVRVAVSQTLPGILPAPFSVGLSPTELAAIDLDGAELDLAKARQNVVFSVISAYLNVLKAQQIKSLNDSALEGASNFLDEVRSKLSLGVATKLDLMKAESQLDQARFNQLKAGDDLDAAMRSLALLLGLPAETSFDLVNDFQVEQEEQNLEELVKLALENRPEVKQASLSVQKARAAVETARRSLWPSVGLSAAYSNQGDVLVSATGSLSLTSGQVGWTLTLANEGAEDSRSTVVTPGAATGSKSTSTSSVGIEVSWPLWDGGVAREKLGQAETNLKIQKSALERQKQAVVEDVYAASVGLKQALLKLELAKKAVDEAEEALRVTKARFEAGAGVVAEVIDATQSLASARAGEVQALFDCYLARARLGKAVGLLGTERWKL
ncbi:MAG: TolC family protein [Firmicutes bacterium]|nr:TolC family protein [Bacillota bacterium]